MPTASVPSVAPSQGMSAPISYQASPTTASVDQAASIPTSQTPQASAPQGNPWQQAFQALSASLNTSSPSQAPAATYQSQVTPTPQAVYADPWASQVPSAQIQAAPISSPQATTRTFSEQEVAHLVGQAQAQTTDAYLSQVSDESLEVLQHFGAEAPALLNNYACAVEDALIEQVQNFQQQEMVLKAMGDQNGAMNVMLTDPDVLADYVNEFYGPEGPYPTETEAEEATRLQTEARAQFESEIQAQERSTQVPASFQRPQMDMPTPGRQASASGDFWGGFSQLMDNNPEQAWQYLSSAPNGALQGKLLVQDS
tara:strand:+ start:87 stop:1022 length:936 start_codon:yes stop_codon:yes gene_type:complete